MSASEMSIGMIEQVAGKGAAFPIPVTVVPVSLSDEEIESLA